LNKSLEGKVVRVRARLHSSRIQGNAAFLVLRKGFHSVQGAAFKNDTVPKELIKYVNGTEKESVIDIVGIVTVPAEPIESCSQKEVEISITGFYVISRSNAELPFQIEDAARPMTLDDMNKAEEEVVEENEQADANVVKE
jgi:aspartyl-tRNA synthetase